MISVRWPVQRVGSWIWIEGVFPCTYVSTKRYVHQSEYLPLRTDERQLPDRMLSVIFRTSVEILRQRELSIALSIPSMGSFDHLLVSTAQILFL